MIRSNHFISAALLLSLICICLGAGCLTEENGEPARETPKRPAYITEDDGAVSLLGSGGIQTAIPLSAGVHLMTMETGCIDDRDLDSSQVFITTKNEYIRIEGRFTSEALPFATENGKASWSYAFMLRQDADADIRISHEGPWRLTFSVPEMINAIPPQSFSGVGTAATPFFMIPQGTYSCDITLENGTFIGVHLMDYDGNLLPGNGSQVLLPLHELRDGDDELFVGDYTTTVPVTIKRGDNYLLNVLTDGAWSVHLSPA
ncbi:MAG: hypothetical protein D5R99_04100 [Methanocalculus sp. MSAO_Arc1]|uniref:hypothetical protein n=1 Tax=Methanocalculus TaxID=71151 RepID=UPI000FEF9CDD|nr:MULTISPECIES: hypothetical protein [unclassified Methanocalculus]MCP1661714.1 hypothetical protein [Methanocalculus sp. AMF5]RQD80770.1 MAG: hypothetical protein D5R99_04100 [Methanocalculus sp. MSAO_Arc1]